MSLCFIPKIHTTYLPLAKTPALVESARSGGNARSGEMLARGKTPAQRGNVDSVENSTNRKNGK